MRKEKLSCQSGMATIRLRGVDLAISGVVLCGPHMTKLHITGYRLYRVNVSMTSLPRVVLTTTVNRIGRRTTTCCPSVRPTRRVGNPSTFLRIGRTALERSFRPPFRPRDHD